MTICKYLAALFWSLAYIFTQVDCSFYQEVCANERHTSMTVALSNCSQGTMIHVREEAIGKATSACRLQRDSECNVDRSSTGTGLTVNCNGRQSCLEAVASPVDRCNSTTTAVRVWYECIAGSLNLCSATDQVRTGPVYLHSPGFPDSVISSDSVGDTSEVCSCRITGSHMRLELLELYSIHVLAISADGHLVWSGPRHLPVQYNRLVVRSANTLTLMFAATNTTGKQNVWVKITGNGGGPVRVRCFGNDTDLSTTVSTFQNSLTPTSTTSPLMSLVSATTSATTSTSKTLTSLVSKTSTVSSFSPPTPVSSLILSSSSSQAIQSSSSSSSSSSTSLSTKPETSSKQSTSTMSHHAINNSVSVLSSVTSAEITLGVTVFILLSVLVTVIAYYKIWKPRRQRLTESTENVEEIAYISLPHVYEEIRGQSRDQTNRDETSRDYLNMQTFVNISDRQRMVK